jgi:site-specific DNA-methyltransferase (adenine-specific)
MPFASASLPMTGTLTQHSASLSRDSVGRVEHIGDCTLHLGDCRDVLPALPNVDAVVTDPPYGVGLDYESTDDTTDFVQSVAVPAIEKCRLIASRVVLTPGIKNLFLYPKPDHTGSIYYPSGNGLNAWGFTCWQPVLYYGKDPYGGKGSRPDSFHATDGAEKNGHPCPKPIGQMLKLVERTTLPGETILDPFMGSGTTGVACAKLGRKFIGIEIEPKYFDIACRRIEAAYAQPDMFVTPPAKPVQEALI